MSNHTTLKTLFATLHGTLPYEYDEKYFNSAGREAAIIISKTNSERSICITEHLLDDNVIFNVTLYDDTYDDNPIEISQGDTDDQDFTITSIIHYIRKTL